MVEKVGLKIVCAKVTKGGIGSFQRKEFKERIGGI